MARALMIQGTCSGAGKSLVTAGLLRILSRRGISCAPFKAQNMALNSYITRDGAEIGRAQALQAEAAALEPSADMNPVLLKATGESGCQVVINGRVHANMSAGEYYDYASTAWPAVTAAYERLSSRHDLIVIEGAGSPAEINLARQEIVNMRVALHTGAPVVLVGDIERGGVFASLYGTVKLLEPREAATIKAFVINRFRGDVGILEPGLRMIEERTGVPVAGVVPFVRGLGLDEEDGLSIDYRDVVRASHRLRVVVVRLGFISNFTDFGALEAEPDVDLIYSANPLDIESADLLIVPGTKCTTGDLARLRTTGLDSSIGRAASAGVPVIGICGGYQMLGHRVLDPQGIEKGPLEAAGLGLLDIETTIAPRKVTSRSTLESRLPGVFSKMPMEGYEIHMGRTTGDVGLFDLTRHATGERVPDGSLKGNVWGTYLHGIFDNDHFRHELLSPIRAKRGLPVPDAPLDYAGLRAERMDAWADVLEASVDMKIIEGLI